MEKHIKEHLIELLNHVRHNRYEDQQFGWIMMVGGYSAGLMHAGAITVIQWGRLLELRDNANKYWKMENQK